MEMIRRCMIELIRFELCGGTLSSETEKELAEVNLRELFLLSKKYDLTHIITDVLDKKGLLPKSEEGKEVFLRERQLAIFRHEQIRYELQEICDVLESKKIPYMPLKGAVMCEVYPEAWLRTRCDIDILVHKQDVKEIVRILCEEKGYKDPVEGAHDVSLYSASGVHLELHFFLMEEGGGTLEEKEVLSSVWENAFLVKDSAYHYCMTDEMFYFFHIAHMAKHFRSGGCGVRPLIDLWLLNHVFPFDEKKRKEFLKKGGLLRFEEGVKRTSEVWFSGAESDDLTKEIEKYIFQAGMYGEFENRVLVQRKKKGGFKYIFSRIFMPYKQMKIQYPILKKQPWLYPFCQIGRWFKVIFHGKSARRSRKELKSFSNAEKKEHVFALVEELGL